MKIPPPLRNYLRRNRFVRFLYFDCHFADIPILLGIGQFKRDMRQALNEFLSEDKLLNQIYIQSISKDIKSCYFRYKTTPQEYFLFKLEGKSRNERQRYLSDHMIMKLVANKSGRKIHDVELNDKYSFYLINKSYFRREAIYFDSSTTFDTFRQYTLSSRKFIAKPNSAALGHGVEIFTVETAKDAEAFFKCLKRKGADYILEDIIIQDPNMAVWNSSSVNTIRINSFLNNDKFNAAFPFIRTGRKGSIVDNGGQGGIFASIDIHTGEICTDGMDEKGNTYKGHPDSKVIYRGWQIPKWKELLQLTEQIHRNMPKHRYVSWDFAFTNDGWVLIEGNWGEFVCQQMTYNQGLKKEFISLLNN